MADGNEVAVRDAHRWNPHTGTCTCKWEPESDRGAEQAHARHVERVLRGLAR